MLYDGFIARADILMTRFVLRLQSALQSDQIDSVISFVGEDASGSFGILAGHARIITCLKYGLCWFRHENDAVEYLALPGGILYFNENILTISMRHYLRSSDYQTMVAALDQELRQEEENLRSMKESIQRLDEEMLKHLWELKRKYHHGTE